MAFRCRLTVEFKLLSQRTPYSTSTIRWCFRRWSCLITWQVKTERRSLWTDNTTLDKLFRLSSPLRQRPSHQVGETSQVAGLREFPYRTSRRKSGLRFLTLANMKALNLSCVPMKMRWVTITLDFCRQSGFQWLNVLFRTVPIWLHAAHATWVTLHWWPTTKYHLTTWNQSLIITKPVRLLPSRLSWVW